MTISPLHYFVFSNKTAFLPFRDLYGECFFLIKEHPNISPAQCYYTECSANKNCAEVMVHRVNFLFEKVLPREVGLIIAYFKYQDRPQSVRGVTFFRDLREPKVMILNKSAFEKCYTEGHKFAWVPDSSFLRIGHQNKPSIIPVDNLTRDTIDRLKSQNNH